MDCEILQQDIQSLLECFSKNLYKAKDSESGTMGYEVMQKCSVLMKLDYNVVEISNSLGELSSSYPSQILIPEYEIRNNSGSSGSSNCSSSQGHGNGVTSATASQKQQPNPPPTTIYESANDPAKLRDLINKARFARCRARFPLPVILYKGKHICRSATLSGGPEIYGRSGLDYFFYGVDTAATTTTNTATRSSSFDEAEVFEAQEAATSPLSDETPVVPTNAATADKNSGEWQLFDRVRSQDIKLLKSLNIGTIVDFMVEKKKVKFGMNVTSSEKVDKEKRYSDFTIISLPYPGCEFFREFRDNNYSGEGLVFDWGQAYVDACIGVPDDLLTAQLNVDWESYKAWDLVKITQNYLKLLLKYIHENSSGLLIHCISGWDRTPLFVSLLRLSLWADGAIHQSLNATQILYFTIAYDWFLFGHNLPDRLSKGEEIFFFCFYVLKYIMEDEFTTVTQRCKSKHSSGSSSIGVLRTDSECMLDGILFEGESRGSSISLNSTCSCISGKSHQDCIASTHLLPDENINGNVFGHSNDSNSSVGCLSNDSNLAVSQAWSPQPKRTSPVSVPMPATKLRQRQESSSSLSVGSWQMISTTGSLRSSDSTAALQAQNAGEAPTPQQQQQMQSSTSTVQSVGSNGGSSSVTMTNNSATTTPNANQIVSSHESDRGTLLDDDCFSPNFTNEFYNLRRDRLTAVRSLFYNCYSSTIGYKFRTGNEATTFGTLLGNFAEKVGLAQRTSV